MSPVWVRPSSSALARPKSVIQTTPGGVEQQVRRLDVAVDDPAGVGVGQALRRLAGRSGRCCGHTSRRPHSTVEIWRPARQHGRDRGRRRERRVRAPSEPARGRPRCPVAGRESASVLARACSGVGARSVDPRSPAPAAAGPATVAANRPAQSASAASGSSPNRSVKSAWTTGRPRPDRRTWRCRPPRIVAPSWPLRSPSLCPSPGRGAGGARR